MGNYNNFSAALAAGRKGEALAATFLEQQGYIIEDVSDSKQYQLQDIDLIAQQEDRLALTIEVKADSRIADTGNICVETITNKSAKKKGWFFYTKALFIFFVDIQQEVIHCVRTNELRELYNNNSFKHIETKQFECGEYLKLGEIALIPLNKIEKLPHYKNISA